MMPPIRMEKPKRDVYVRVRPSSITGVSAAYADEVGIVVGKTPTMENMQMMVVDLIGDNESKVFNANDLELITKKEYFKGALRG